MYLKRRGFLAVTAMLGASALLPRASPAADRRVVIVGGGWGGLAAARYLRELAPELDVTLVERKPVFRSTPLSNKWLVGQIDGTLLSRDYVHVARQFGYRHIAAEATAIDRAAQRVETTAGSLAYDWLVLALGIRHDYTVWFGNDRDSAELARRLYAPAWTADDELLELREKLARFRGGDLLMTIPPQPFRCPPASYERALLIAGWFEARGIPGRIVIIDPNPPFREFQKIFSDRHPQRIVYHPQTTISGVDLARRVVIGEFGDFPFDDAILMPPQQAGDLAWQAGLIGMTTAGQPTGWAAADPLTLVARADSRIFLIGDMLGRVSPLFGHYPKTAQIAVRQGRIVALQIAARARGTLAATVLPDSQCHIATAFDPPESLHISARYRVRGDGELIQQQVVRRDSQPRGEDIAWLQGLLAEVVGSQ